MGTKCNPLVGIKEDARVGIKRTPRVGTKRRQEVRSEEIEKVTSSPCPLLPNLPYTFLLAVTDKKEAEMTPKGGEETIMLRHHLKTLNE